MKIMVLDQHTHKEIMVLDKLTPKDINMLESVGKSLQGTIASVIELFHVQARLISELSPEEVKEVKYLLSKVLDVECDEVDQPENVSELNGVLANILGVSVDTNNKSELSESSEPEYLSTLDVSKIMNVSPQIVRRYCQDGSIKAWRTLGNRGEWRIEVEQFKDHPGYQAYLVKRNRKQLATVKVVDGLEKLSKESNYLQTLERIEQERNND